MTSLWTTVCENLKHVPTRLPVLLRTGTDTHRRGYLISFASFQGDREEESLFAAISRMRPGVDPDMIYRHVFVRHDGRNVSLQDILINWSPELIRDLHLNTTAGTMPESDDEPVAAAAASAKARWSAETSTSTAAPNATGVIANATSETPIAVATATVTTVTTSSPVDGKCVPDSMSAAAILRRLQIRYDTLKAEYDLLVSAEPLAERTKALERQIAAMKANLMG